MTLYDPAFRRDDIPGGKFDMVIYGDVLEHVPEDEGGSTHRGLFRAGRLIIWRRSAAARPRRPCRWHQHARGRSALRVVERKFAAYSRLRASPSCWWTPVHGAMGDWLMAAGEARLAHEKTGRPVLVTDPVGTPQWSEVFPKATRTSCVAVRGRRLRARHRSSGNRPVHRGQTAGRWTWKPVHADLGGMFFTDAELAVRRARTAQDHGRTRRQNRSATRTSCGSRTLARTGRHDSTTLRAVWPGHRHEVVGGAPAVPTTTFRQALAVLSVCRALVTTEGGLMHGAAAVGTPAVVLWSEFIAPNVTATGSYNIRHAHRTCGHARQLSSCRKSMEQSPSARLRTHSRRS